LFAVTYISFKEIYVSWGTSQKGGRQIPRQIAATPQDRSRDPLAKLIFLNRPYFPEGMFYPAGQMPCPDPIFEIE
jgi:hypothetical protein